MFHPLAPAGDDDAAAAYPCIEIAGVQVYVYVHPEDDHMLRISLHCNGAAAPLVRGANDCVPVTIMVGGDGLLWVAGRSGATACPSLAEPRRRPGQGRPSCH